MWRINGIVGRVLNRCHVTSPLRLTQGHHVEDDVLNSSSLLSTSLHPTESSSLFSSSGSHNGENGDQQQKEKTFHYYSAGLPRFTALDAVGWGAAAVLFVQLSRRVHSHLSNCDQSHLREPTQIYRCGYRVLVDLLTRQSVLPRRVNVNCLRSLENQSTSSGESSSFTGSSTSSTTQESAFNHDDLDTDKVLAVDTTDNEEGGHRENQTENKKETFTLEDKLTWAMKNLQSVTDSSISTILNIIGLEYTKAGDYRTAFSCFSMAASQGYCKAQFNLGVCYEKGRGVVKNMEKAAVYYKQAATAGHSQAQYQYAKYILHSKATGDTTDTRRTIRLMEQAAASGLKEAQAYLGVLFTREPYRDEKKAVLYLKMAAQNGDSQSQFNLGQCYERGFGVRQCYRTAIDHYRQAAEAGNGKAQLTLTNLYCQGTEGEAARKLTARNYVF
ncbi:death ligand signal enhancer isoform X3 [Polyodon spathula]|uniref:death ligand signal enhancer isoform X3 n=1 Tax=Polyodon spathula TaxID=7913 RepID=UPI001B7E1D64|nr:death ligand signal enhancer isoform X3 [Polyodon spathula]